MDGSFCFGPGPTTQGFRFTPPSGEWLGSTSSLSQRHLLFLILSPNFSQLCCLPAEFSHTLHLLLKRLLSHIYLVCGYLSQHSEDQLFPPSVVLAFFGVHPSWSHSLAPKPNIPCMTCGGTSLLGVPLWCFRHVIWIVAFSFCLVPWAYRVLLPVSLTRCR